MVRKKDVIAAYRMLFSREPENEQVVTHYTTEVADRRALRQLFMSSSELREKYENMQPPRPPRPPFKRPPMNLERVLADLLAQLCPDGIAFFQVSTYKAGYRFHINDCLTVENGTEIEMHFFPQAACLELIAAQGCRVQEIREDDSIGLSVTAISNNLLVQKAA